MSIIIITSLLQGNVSSGGRGEWNGRPYQSIPLNQGMEDEVGDKESIIPDQMIGKEVYDDEMNGNIADEPCVESINSSQEEEGEDNGNNSFTCEAIFYTCSKSHSIVHDVAVAVVGDTISSYDMYSMCYTQDKPLIMSHGMCCRVLLSIVYVSCITGVCVLDEKYVPRLNTCNGTVYYSIHMLICHVDLSVCYIIEEAVMICSEDGDVTPFDFVCDPLTKPKSENNVVCNLLGKCQQYVLLTVYYALICRLVIEGLTQVYTDIMCCVTIIITSLHY